MIGDTSESRPGFGSTRERYSNPTPTCQGMTPTKRPDRAAGMCRGWLM